MPRNLTPVHLRCQWGACPAIHELDDGSLLIVGKSATMAAACERISVGEGEHAVIVDRELVAGVAADALIAARAEIDRLRAALEPIAEGFPHDLAETVERLAATGLDWGCVEAKPDAEHASDFADSLAMTRAYHNLGDGPLVLHGVYLKGSEVVVCHTGTSPNSGATARVIAGLIESTPRIVASARAALSSPSKFSSDTPPAEKVEA